MPLIQEDAPHPLSYRPDLPLRSELDKPLDERSYEAGREDAHNEDKEDAEYEANARVRVVESELETARTDLENVQDELEAAREELQKLKGAA